MMQHQAVLELAPNCTWIWEQALQKSPLARGLWNDMQQALDIRVTEQHEQQQQQHDGAARTSSISAAPILNTRMLPWFMDDVFQD